ncbi:MAG: hypothetical protein ACSHXZ_04545 [Gammaproteobacteria bacterium]
MLRFLSPVIKALTLAGALSSLFVLPANASTVLEMSFAQVVEHSQLVFEGQVLSVEPRHMNDGYIHTFVRFEIADVVKGDYSDAIIELSFLGGEIAGNAMHVTDMQIPQVGETGLYFVETLQQSQVSPLVGWAQGHYLIETLADGARIVTTLAHEVVVSLEDTATQAPQSSALNSFSKGKAKGVLIKEQSLLSPLSRALNVEDFKTAVRDMAGSAL